MFFGVVLIAILLVVSGAIAYMGDNLGRKIGKKKVSVAGLRPKHTSILITIITGVLITSLTLGVILVASRTARTALFGLQELYKKHAKTERGLVEKETELKSLKRELDARNKDLRKQDEKLSRKQDELDRLVKQTRVTTDALKKNEKALKKIDKDLKKSNADIKKLGAQRARLERERKSLMVSKNALQREISDMAVQITQIQKDTLHGDFLYQKHQKLARFQVEPDIPRTELERSLEKAVSVLSDAARNRGAEIGPDAKMFNTAQYEKVWNALVNSREGLVVEAKSAVNVFKDEPFYVELQPYENRVLFRKGEVVASANVQAGASEETVRGILSKLINHAMEMARNRGILPDLQTEMVGTMPANRFQEALQTCAGARKGLVLELFADQDARVADKLHVDFKAR